MDNGEEKGLKVEARSLAPQEGHGVQCTGGGRGSLVGCRLWGRTESDTTEAT